MQDDNITATMSAALLSSVGKILNHWSMLAALATLLAIGLRQANVALAASAVLGLFQAYIAARCAFDAKIFAALGGNETLYKKFDDLLERCKLRGTNTATRTIEERAKGAIRLLYWQALCFFIQLILFTIGLA
jgi:hypothetical protein